MSINQINVANLTETVAIYDKQFDDKLAELNSAFKSKEISERTRVPALFEELKAIEDNYREAKEQEVIAVAASHRFPFAKLAENHRFLTLNHSPEMDNGVQKGYKKTEKPVYVSFFRLMDNLGIKQNKWASDLFGVYQHFYMALRETHSFEEKATAKKLQAYTPVLALLREKSQNGIDIASKSQLGKTLTSVIRELLTIENPNAAPVVGDDKEDYTEAYRTKYANIKAVNADIKHIEYCITARSNNVGAVKLLSVDKFYEVIYDVLNHIVTGEKYVAEISGAMISDSLKSTLSELNYGVVVNPFEA